MESFGGGFGEGFGEPDSNFPPMGDDVSDGGRSRKSSSRKKGRRHKEADDAMYGTGDAGAFGTDRTVSFDDGRSGGQGVGSDFDRNFGARGGSALAEALGSSPASRSNGLTPTSRMSDLGLGDDFRNRDQGFDMPAAHRDFSNFGTGDAAAGAGLEPVKRGFSFNMNDMPVPQQNARRGEMQRAAMPRWNPLEGIRRHWDETRKEAQVVHIEHPSVGFHGHGAMTPPVAATYNGYEGGPPGTLENELARTEGRVQALRTKLARLESDMVYGAQSPVSGHLRIVMDHLVDGGRLGLHMRGTKLADIIAPEAREFGWFVGDEVLKVNGYPVNSEADFAREVARATDAYHVTRRPVVFDIYRAPHPGAMMGGSPVASPYASPIHSPMGSYVPPPGPPAIMGPPGMPPPHGKGKYGKPGDASPPHGKGMYAPAYAPPGGMPMPNTDMKGMPKGSFMGKGAEGKGKGRPPYGPPLDSYGGGYYRPSPSGVSGPTDSIDLSGNPFAVVGGSMASLTPSMQSSMTIPPTGISQTAPYDLPAYDLPGGASPRLGSYPSEMSMSSHMTLGPSPASMPPVPYGGSMTPPMTRPPFQTMPPMGGPKGAPKGGPTGNPYASMPPMSGSWSPGMDGPGSIANARLPTAIMT